MFRWFHSKKEDIKIESPVPNLETEWVVLEKDRYSRQRLNSKVALKNFSIIENIKEELKRMKNENEEILFNAEFGFEQVMPTNNSLFSEMEYETPSYSSNKGYKQRYVSWTEENILQNSKYRDRNIERSLSVDNIFRMSMSFSEIVSSENPETNSEDEMSLKFEPVRARSEVYEGGSDLEITPTESEWDGRRIDRRKCSHETESIA